MCTYTFEFFLQVLTAYFDHALDGGCSCRPDCGREATEMYYARPCHAKVLADWVELPVPSCGCGYDCCGIVSQKPWFLSNNFTDGQKVS